VRAPAESWRAFALTVPGLPGKTMKALPSPMPALTRHPSHRFNSSEAGESHGEPPVPRARIGVEPIYTLELIRLVPGTRGLFTSGQD
jgi:hypothetical protein